MFTLAPQYDVDFDTQDEARNLRTALYQDGVAGHLLDGTPAPTPDQVALVLRALADFPLCMRILPLAAHRRDEDPVEGLSSYLTGFARHLARHDESLTYDPRYWILGTPLPERLIRRMGILAALPTTASSKAPSARQSAAVLLALADAGTLQTPRRMLTIAGDGDLPWNGATGLGLWFRQLADSLVV